MIVWLIPDIVGALSLRSNMITVRVVLPVLGWLRGSVACRIKDN